MKKAIYLLAILAAVSCKSDDTDFETLAAQAKEKPKEIVFDESDYTESPDVVPAPTDPAYNDYVESYKPKYKINIEYSADNATITGDTRYVYIQQDNTEVTLNMGSSAVEIILSGNCPDGRLNIVGYNRFKLTLNGLSLTSKNGSAINNQCGKTMYIVCSDNTENKLVCEGAPIETTWNLKAALFSEGQISFSGKGHLTVQSSYRNAIASDDYILVRPGCHITAETSAGSSIKANDGVTINGGRLNLQTTYAGGKAINCENHITINGGRIIGITTGNTRVETVEITPETPLGVDTTSCAAIKCDSTFTMTGGTLRVKSTGEGGKGIRVGQDAVIDGGTLDVVTTGAKTLASPKGFKANGDITVNHGNIYIYSSHSTPLEADGYIAISQYKKLKKYLVEIGY
ncbi:MAG: carbohydrate-binding domain-containing protein [Bacteroidaceae bacterium]|nr:carbohydrate-binding domain-containing protein [Bacteroidaceae bacterium]